MACKDCEHFKVAEKQKDQISVGHCMRFPRASTITKSGVEWLYPLQYEIDTCGEFKPRLMSQVN